MYEKFRVKRGFCPGHQRTSARHFFHYWKCESWRQNYIILWCDNCSTDKASTNDPEVKDCSGVNDVFPVVEQSTFNWWQRYRPTARIL